MNIQNIQIAIAELRNRMTERFGNNVKLFLFGSVARGNYNADSDIDILVLVPSNLTNSIEEEIFDLAYEIELEQDVVFGIIIYSKDFWSSPRARIMPLYERILNEGLTVQ